ncbi:hypothetical protein FORC065_3576 [Yersinia enterocolitica]|nr:hypothetical protein FORC065_3576 [Yersinia enterocolitica]
MKQSIMQITRRAVARLAIYLANTEFRKPNIQQNGPLAITSL